MAFSQAWLLFVVITVVQRFTDAATRTTQIVVPPDSKYLHIDLHGEEYVIPLHGPRSRAYFKSHPTNHYPLSPLQLKKFYAELARINSKNKYLYDKKFGGAAWNGFLGPVPLAPLPHYPPGDEIPSQDVKPVKEHIEDDLKYDFRTKTHYIR